MRKPHDSTLAGKRRTRDLRGEEHGPYRVTEYVGENPLTSIYVRGECKFGCGHRVEIKANSVMIWDRQKRCGGCKRYVVDVVSIST